MGVFSIALMKKNAESFLLDLCNILKNEKTMKFGEIQVKRDHFNLHQVVMLSSG